MQTQVVVMVIPEEGCVPGVKVVAVVFTVVGLDVGVGPGVGVETRGPVVVGVSFFAVVDAGVTAEVCVV